MSSLLNSLDVCGLLSSCGLTKESISEVSEAVTTEIEKRGGSLLAFRDFQQNEAPRLNDKETLRMIQKQIIDNKIVLKLSKDLSKPDIQSIILLVNGKEIITESTVDGKITISTGKPLNYPPNTILDILITSGSFEIQKVTLIM